MKEQLFHSIDEKCDELQKLADAIYDYAECGCEEFKSQSILCEYLETMGFQVEKGIGGLPTAFRAFYRSLGGGIKIGFLCEYDALYGIGHACGHHMQGPSAAGAAAAIKECFGGKLPFDLVVYGCPDEEGYADGGKAVMIENGCFNDIDVAMIMHGGTETTTDLHTLAAVRADAKFISKQDCLDADPDSRSMDAMLEAFEGVEFLREHIADSARIHYTYSVQEKQSDSHTAEFSIRAMTLPYFQEMKERFEAIVYGAAQMAGANVSISYGREYMPKVPVQTLVDSFYENARLAGAELIEGARTRGGSSDTANVSFKLPTIGIRIAFAPKGSSAHSREWLEKGKTESAHKAIIVAAKTMAGMGYDLLTDSSMLAKARIDYEKEAALLKQKS